MRHRLDRQNAAFILRRYAVALGDADVNEADAFDGLLSGYHAGDRAGRSEGVGTPLGHNIPGMWNASSGNAQLNVPTGPVAQWRSRGLIIPWLQVRILPGPPTEGPDVCI